jgi:hypothetical protein
VRARVAKRKDSGGEDYEWLSAELRVLRISLLALVLVTCSTYTANLAAFFNRPAFEVEGPSDAHEFRTSVACTHPYLTGSIAPFVRDVVAMPMALLATVPKEQQEAQTIDWCLAALHAGTADIYIENTETVHMIHLDHCHTTVETPFVRILPQLMAMVLRADDLELAMYLT